MTESPFFSLPPRCVEVGKQNVVMIELVFRLYFLAAVMVWRVVSKTRKVPFDEG